MHMHVKNSNILNKYNHAVKHSARNSPTSNMNILQNALNVIF